MRLNVSDNKPEKFYLKAQCFNRWKIKKFSRYNLLGSALIYYVFDSSRVETLAKTDSNLFSVFLE